LSETLGSASVALENGFFLDALEHLEGLTLELNEDGKFVGLLFGDTLLEDEFFSYLLPRFFVELVD
jgi:hypothetical protein